MLYQFHHLAISCLEGQVHYLPRLPLLQHLSLFTLPQVSREQGHLLFPLPLLFYQTAPSLLQHSDIQEGLLVLLVQSSESIFGRLQSYDETLVLLVEHTLPDGLFLPLFVFQVGHVTLHLFDLFQVDLYLLPVMFCLVGVC